MPRIPATNLLLAVASATLLAFSTPKAALAQRAGGGAEVAAAEARELARAQEREQEQANLAAAQQAQAEAAARRGARAPTRGRRAGGAADGIDDESLRMMMGGQTAAAESSAGGSRNERTTTPPADAPVSKEPKELIAIDVWVINIEMSRAKAADDMVADLVQRANDLPPIVSRDEVRILLGKLAVGGVLRRSREYQLLGTNGQSARSQTGYSQPSITNASSVARGGRVNSFTYRDVGTTIQAMPTILHNGNIQINLSYQASEVQKTSPPVIIADMADGSDPVTADQIVQQQITTSIQLKRGAAAVVVQRDVQADPTNDAATVRSQMVIISASVLPPQN